MAKLTNEDLTALFDNNFELALYAIDIAQRFIKAGREFTLAELIEEVKKNPESIEIEEVDDLTENTSKKA